MNATDPHLKGNVMCLGSVVSMGLRGLKLTMAAEVPF